MVRAGEFFQASSARPQRGDYVGFGFALPGRSVDRAKSADLRGEEKRVIDVEGLVNTVARCFERGDSLCVVGAVDARDGHQAGEDDAGLNVVDGKNA